MSYNNRNFLTRVVTIQTITLEYKEKGCSQEWIFRKLIKPNYNISRSTYYAYLRRNAKKELKKMDVAG